MSEDSAAGTAGGRRSGGRRRGNRGGPEVGQPVERDVNYRQLKNPFPTMDLFSADQVEDMHQTALRMIEELGMKVLLPEARKLFAAGGARVDESTQMVHIGSDMVEAALASAPRSIACRAGARRRDFVLELGSLVFQAGAGALRDRSGAGPARRLGQRLCRVSQTDPALRRAADDLAAGRTAGRGQPPAPLLHDPRADDADR